MFNEQMIGFILIDVCIFPFWLPKLAVMKTLRGPFGLLEFHCSLEAVETQTEMSKNGV